MTDERLERVERRLACAERELAVGRRRARRATGVAVTVVCGALLMALRAPNSEPEPLTVKVPFVVVDRSGKILLQVEDTKDQRGLIVANGHGRAVAGLYSAHDGGQVKVDAPGANDGSATMWITKEGTPRIELDGAGDVPLATLGVDDGRPQLNVYNKTGANVAFVGALSNSGGGLAAYNADRSAHASLGTNEQGQTGLRIRAGGKLLAELGAAEKGNVRLKIWGAGAAPVAMMGSKADGSGGAVVVANGAGAFRGALDVVDDGGQVSVWGAGDNPLAQLGVDGGSGTMRIYNKAGASLVWMNESAHGSGYLAVADPSGAPAAELGYNGTGIVRALGPGGKIDYLRGPR